MTTIKLNILAVKAFNGGDAEYSAQIFEEYISKLRKKSNIIFNFLRYYPHFLA